MPPSFSSGPQWTCTDCGEKHPAGKEHTCVPVKLEKYQLEKAWHQMGGEGKSPIDVEKSLTPRLRKRIEFHRWLRENERL